ncbi:hypothetical protein [Falsiroseomonas tokyonensis]|uniref:Phage tail tape measure protein n=1 Tax=Falsiroseomonas tokyonensis TaxID=430521 RepID=A0ABV7BXG6_9PROT|nr:hypothetical protein [Falsiroseomonas tokyonensis]MBU8538736.1 hypothetical protein [Falsiroseomonas tokyonensis]
MTVSRKFQAVVTLEDKTAGPLRALAARLAAIGPVGAGIGRSLQGVSDRLARIGNSTAVYGLARSMNLLGRGIQGVNNGMTNLAALGGVTGAGVVAGLLGMGRATMTAVGNLADLSARTGMTVRDLRGLEHAARMADVEMPAAVTAVERLSRGMYEAATGRNRELAELFQRNNIALRDGVTGQVRTAAEVLPQLADLFADNTNQALRNSMANALFSRPGSALIAALQQGGAALREQWAEGFRLNPQVNDDNIGALDRAEDAYAKLGVAITGVRDAISVRLMPALAPLIERMTEFVRVNQDLVGERVSEWVKGVADAMAEWDLPAIARNMEKFAGAAGAIYRALGGIEGILVGSIILKLATVIGGIGAAILGLPAAAITAAAAAIGGAAYIIWRNWEGIEDMFRRIGDAMERAGQQMRDAFRSPPLAPAVPQGSLPGFPAVPGTPSLPGATPRGLIPGLPRFPSIPGVPGGLPGLPRPLGSALPLGPSLASSRGAGPARTPEGRLVVEFANLPRDARVRQERADPGLPDLVMNVGYARPFAV